MRSILRWIDRRHQGGRQRNNNSTGRQSPSESKYGDLCIYLSISSFFASKTNRPCMADNRRE